MLRQIFYKLPPSFRFLARRIWYFPIDVLESGTGSRPPMTPPRGYIYTGSGDFVKGGEKWLRFFKERDLKPHHQFLDIGSGIGRIARSLTGFITKEGRYEGFDAIKLGVEWCEANISKSNPNFHFKYIPLANDLYRPDGQDATQLRFPYQDSSFDFAVLISVFTHFLPKEVEQYFNEIQRVLNTGGTCVATFFVLNAQPIENKGFQFPHRFAHYALMDAHVKAANVAFTETYLEKIIADTGLVISEKIEGFWRTGIRQNEAQDFQDVWVIKKP
jgi:ubiquinone/menaquinone biosynthesis C-methylase UbiE